MSVSYTHLDAYFDEEQNIILTSQHKMYAYPIGGVPVLLNSYYLKSVTYVNRSSCLLYTSRCV